MLRHIFCGSLSFYVILKYKVPLYLFWDWLYEKWIADLKVLAWCLVFSPYLLVAVLGVTLSIIGELLYKIKVVIPDKLFLSEEYRDKQIKKADYIRKYYINSLYGKR